VGRSGNIVPLRGQHGVAPVLDLGGPQLRAALEDLVEASASTGGIDVYVNALGVKSALFAALLGRDAIVRLDENLLRDLLALMPTVRRRARMWLDKEGAASLRARIITLMEGHGREQPVDELIAQFTGQFPAGNDYRWTRDLAAEILHFTAPDRCPLMTRWIWDGNAKTGVLREIWFDDAIDEKRVVIRDDFATFKVLADEIAGFLRENGFFRELSLCQDVMFAHVYARYINDRGNQFLKGDFGGPEDRMAHTRRMLGLDAPGAKKNRIAPPAIADQSVPEPLQINRTRHADS